MGFDFNYFKNTYVITFIIVLTLFLIIVLFYRKRHGIKYKSATSMLMGLFYVYILLFGIYISYHEILADYYYKNNLYNEATYRFMKADEIRTSLIFSLVDRAIIFDSVNRESNKMMSFYISKNYSKAIPYLKKSYELEKNRKRNVFLKLYLAHSYLETGNEKGELLLFSSYLEASCFLAKKDLVFFENIIRLNQKLNDKLSPIISDSNL